LCFSGRTALLKTFRINCINFKGIGKEFPAEVVGGYKKIHEPEVLGCHRFLKYATDVYKNVSEVMYGSRIINNASDADSTPLMY